MGLPKKKLEIVPAHEAEDITEIFYTWLNNFQSEHTKRAYKTDFFKFFNFINTNHPEIKNFAEITPLVVSSYRDFLLSQKKANKTINRKLATISSFLTALVAEQKIKVNPVVCRRPPSETIRLKTWLNKPEAEKVLETFNQDTASGRMNYLLTKTLYLSAQRFSSIANLKVKDLAEMNDFLVISIELKGGRKKLLPLPKLLSEELKNYVADEKLKPDDYIFTGKKGIKSNKPVDNKTYNEVLRVAGKRAKLKKPFTSHRLRASTLSDLIRKGYELPRIQAQVSFHKSIETLMIYKNERDYEDIETNLLLESESKDNFRDNYETPEWLSEAIKKMDFNLALDIAGTPENKKAKRVITAEENSLITDWVIGDGEWIWGNIPYSKKEQFIEKMLEQKQKGYSRQIQLLPVFPETNWFKRLREEVADYLVFLNKRLSFKLAGVEENAKFASVLAIVGDLTEAQKEDFRTIGWLVPK